MSNTYSDKIILDTPIKRGDKTLDSLKLRTPNSGELRGLSLVDLGQLDVSALHKLLPRISEPTITEEEARQLSVADLVQLGGQVSDFLLPNSLKATLAQSS